MRLVKPFGLATGLALVTTALVGAVPAAGVTMCMTEGNASKECPTGKAYLAREYKAKLQSGTTAVLEGEGEISLSFCLESTVTAKTTKKEGNPLPGEITSLSLSSCKICTVGKLLNLPYSFGITSTGDGKKDGDLKVTKLGGPPQVEFTNCFGTSATCRFGAAGEKIDLEFKGGLTATVVASQEPFQYVGGTSEMVCGKTAKFTATYELTEPAAAWVTAFP